MSKKSDAVVLCEDIQHRVFFVKMLKELGFKRIRPLPLPVSCGEQYVRNEYSKQVISYRQNENKCAFTLVIVIDADLTPITSRLRQLTKSLKDYELNDRQPTEKIALFIPNRNIETWIENLIHNSAVNEVAAYEKLSGHERDCHPAVEHFIILARQSPKPTDRPPSMLHGFAEFQRIS